MFQIGHAPGDPPPPHCNSPALLNNFHPLSLCYLKDIMAKLKPSSSPSDFIPARYLKKVFNSVDPTILSTVNSSLSSGCVLSYLR